ncbi:MAG: TonB-dependent receptor, partial [Flavobacteriaceae bacterium]|nr:TonB-dependent receptor [Flavobacteriaceae bacterium]
TYTELYTNIPNFLSGNSELKPEKALAEELGINYTIKKLELTGAIFRREAKDLIDYIKETEESPIFVAQNLREVTTSGFELNAAYNFILFNNSQRVKLGYTFLEDDYHDTNVFASRYLIDTSIKNHFTGVFDFTIAKIIKPSVTYKYLERPQESYSIVDAKLAAAIKSFSVFILVNNVFDTEYYEKDNVIMPRSNFEFGLTYTFR